MKKIIFAVLLSSLSLFAQEAKKPSGIRAKTGGIVIKPLPEGAKAFVILDTTKEAPEAASIFLKRFIAVTGRHAEISTSSLEEQLEKGNAVAAILPKGGEAAIYPSRKYVAVPDTGDSAKTAADLWKATIGLFSLLADAPNDFHGGGIVNAGAEAIGIPVMKRAFYKKALEEGWAPPPKDEFQKALWDAHKAK